MKKIKKIEMEHIVFFVISVILIFVIIAYPGEKVPEQNIDTVDEKSLLTKEEFNEMFRKSSEIVSFEFDYNDTLLDKNFHYYMKGSDVRAVLPEPEYNDGELYDTVFFTKLYDVAYSYCSKNICEKKDLTAEPVDFDRFYLEKPTWIYSRIINASLVRYEMFGNHNTSLIEFEDDFGNKGRMWVQNYYKIPLRIEYSDYEGQERIIEYNNFFWNHLKLFHVAIPGNVTLVDYEGGSANPTIFTRTLTDRDFPAP